jgi:type III restriction enzyme
MLREGWDVRNVTTIVPLRPYSSKANILPEQTLGRGLRRMTPPGRQGANEIVTVVEHPAFASLYQQELAQEGLPVEIVDVDHVPATTISIYPDEARKDLKALEIEIPTVAAGYRVVPKLEDLTIKDVKVAFTKGNLKPLPLGKAIQTEIEYEGRHLFTGEVIERMKINLPLLETGIGAVSYYVKQLETICKLRGLHAALAPLIQTFFEEILFEKKTNLFDPELTSRLGDPDVAEHIRAVFIPLIRNKTTKTETRTVAGEPMRLSLWKAFQVTHSERRPALEAKKTLFNLVPCNRELEVALTKLADRAPDVEAFAKNAGPQCLRVDYLADGGRLAFYTPDFFIRTKDKYYLVETKGREDRDVPRKARAAIAWCESASKAGTPWEYLYVPQGVFERFNAATVGELANTCRPALETLIESDDFVSKYPLFAVIADQDEEIYKTTSIVSKEILEALPSRYKKAAEQALALFNLWKNKEDENLAPIFACLLGSIDEVAKGVIIRKLEPELPGSVPDQKAWFEIYFGYPEPKNKRHYEGIAQNLKRTLVFKNGVSPFGLLRNCYDYALNDNTKLTGVFEAVKKNFRVEGARAVLDMVNGINDFRNNYVAHHGEGELTDKAMAEQQLKAWIEGLNRLSSI